MGQRKDFAMILTFDLYGPGFPHLAGAGVRFGQDRAASAAPVSATGDGAFPSFYRLFDRHTGEPAPSLGLPVTCTAANFAAARARLLHNRDPRRFDVRLESPGADMPPPEAGPAADKAPGPALVKERPVTVLFPAAATTLARLARRLQSAPNALPRTGAAIALAVMASTPLPARAESLLNASYDPTRELYRAINEAFTAKWTADGNEAPQIEASHGGSGSQARAVIEGLDAQVITLALAADIDKIAKAGKLAEDWQSKLPHNSSPYTSTIVFLVREGNPKGIKDWGDLTADGVEVITPNPKTSGGARWNFLAAWAWAEKNGKDPQEFVKAIYTHVPVLDKGARDSTTTFAQREIGDVLLAWENEAYLALAELGDDKFDIVVPSVSVLAEPPVAVVDANIHSDGQKKLADAYLAFLYSPEGQAIIFKNFYRGWDTSKADPADVDRFPQLDLVDITHFGGWGEAQKKFFADGGVFDQIYASK